MSTFVRSQGRKWFVVLFAVSVFAAILIVKDGMDRSTSALAANPCWVLGLGYCWACGQSVPACSNTGCLPQAGGGVICPANTTGQTRTVAGNSWLYDCIDSPSGYYNCQTGAEYGYWECVANYNCGGCGTPTVAQPSGPCQNGTQGGTCGIVSAIVWANNCPGN